MAERPSKWHPNPDKHNEVIIQNVRVGEKLGVLYSGAGARFDLNAEAKKRKALGQSTFEAIYVKAEMDDGTTAYRRIMPGGADRTILEADGHLLGGINGRGNLEFDSNPKAFANPPQFVVIPRFSQMSKDLIKTLPSTTLKDDWNAAMRRSRRTLGVNRK